MERSESAVLKGCEFFNMYHIFAIIIASMVNELKLDNYFI